MSLYFRSDCEAGGRYSARLPSDDEHVKRGPPKRSTGVREGSFKNSFTLIIIQKEFI